MVSIKKTVHTLAVVVAVIAGIGLIAYMSLPDTPPELPDGFTFEIADTPEERTQGLSGRTTLAEDTGLLFIFPEAGEHRFWMKDMLISIDILWLADDGTVVGIEENVHPDTFPQAFTPPEPVRYVLEVAAGVAQARGWNVGSVVPIR